MKQIISYLFLLLLSTNTLFAQSSSETIKSESNWLDRMFIQARGGLNLSMNEDLRFGSSSHAIHWGTDIGLGKEFNPYWGMIIDVAYNKNAGMAHYSIEPHIYNTFNSAELFVNGSYNLTNAFLGLKKKRSGYLYGHFGLGVAYTFGLDDRDYKFSPKDNNFAFAMKAGFTYIYNFSRRFSALADLSLSAFTDAFNGRSAGVPFDMHANFSVGVRLHLGQGAQSWVKDPLVQYVDRIVHRTDTVTVVEHDIEQLEYKPMNAKVYSVFFAINSIDIRDSELDKLSEMAQYLIDHPSKMVFVLGYADKNTGNQARNYYLGKNRSLVVSNYLIEHYGIDRSRIINITEEGDKVQPYKLNYENNRVAICIISDFSDTDDNK